MSAPACRKTDPSKCPADSVLGPSSSASGDVQINQLGALRREDVGSYPCESGPKPMPAPVPGKPNPAPPPTDWHVTEAAATVFVNDLGLAAVAHATLHPHGAGALATGSGDVFVGGPTSSVLEESRADAIALIDKVLEALDRWNEDDRERFREWFGDDSEAARDEMRAKYLKMRDALANVEFVAIADNIFGQVNRNDPSKLRLGQLYWKTKRLGEDSRAGVVVHEVSHYTVGGDTHDQKMTRSSDGQVITVYGRDNSRELATKNPAAARANADNVEYFAETQP